MLRTNQLRLCLLISAIDCTSVTWHVTYSSIQGMVEGLFTNATATNKTTSDIVGRREGSHVLFTGLYPGATYDVSLMYENNSLSLQQCHHTLTICKYNSVCTKARKKY